MSWAGAWMTVLRFLAAFVLLFFAVAAMGRWL